MEQTLIIFKPSSLERGLVGRVVPVAGGPQLPLLLHDAVLIETCPQPLRVKRAGHSRHEDDATLSRDSA